MFFRWIYHILALLLAFIASVMPALAEVPAPAEESKPHIVFFQAVGKVSTSWDDNIYSLAKAAAADLDLNLEIVKAPASRTAMMKAVEGRIETGPAPEYALITNYFGEAPDVLNYLNKRGVKIFLLNTGLTKEEYEEIGLPREKLINWIGELVPADEQAGYDLARHLIQTATEKYGDRRLRMIGLTGSYLNPVANERVRGLRRAIAEYPQIDLLQVVSAGWAEDIAESKYPLIQGRYGDIDIVWAANDAMALGVMKALSDEEEVPVIGGMDWAGEALEAVSKNELDSSFGGHVINVAYALVLLKKYASGHDFADSVGQTSLRSFMEPLTSENIEKFRTFIEVDNGQFFNFTFNEDVLFHDAVRENISVNWFLQAQRGRE